MPIYAYKCESCGFAKDVLQKLSDIPLTECPACTASTFKKQLTSAGFQLKGSGWYATDFKGGSVAAPATSAGSEASSAETQGAKPAESQGASKESASPAAPTAAAAGACGGSCSCH